MSVCCICICMSVCYICAYMYACRHIRICIMYPVIHSFRLFLLRPFKSSTTQRRSRLQHGYCIGVSRQSAQATVGKGLAQGPYVVARAGVKPTTLRLKVMSHNDTHIADDTKYTDTKS